MAWKECFLEYSLKGNPREALIGALAAAIELKKKKKVQKMKIFVADKCFKIGLVA